MAKKWKWLPYVLEGLGGALLIAGTLFFRALLTMLADQNIETGWTYERIGTYTIGLGVILLSAGFCWRFLTRPKQQESGSVSGFILRTGYLSVLVGSLYLPWSPGYLLGEEMEAEITAWGRWSIWGGLLAYAGSLLISHPSNSIRRILLLVGAAGMLLTGLAQVFPILFYLMYWGLPIAESAISNPLTAGLFPMVPHLLLGGVSFFTLVHMIRLLAGTHSPTRLTRKQTVILACVMGILGVSWAGWDFYQNQTWIKATYPVDGAVGVELRPTIAITWEGKRDNGGINVYYGDDPGKRYIPAMSGFSPEGMIYTPEEPFLPNKHIIVEVESGTRSHRFSFTTGP